MSGWSVDGKRQTLISYNGHYVATTVTPGIAHQIVAAMNAVACQSEHPWKGPKCSLLKGHAGPHQAELHKDQFIEWAEEKK